MFLKKIAASFSEFHLPDNNLIFGHFLKFIKLTYYCNISDMYKSDM